MKERLLEWWRSRKSPEQMTCSNLALGNFTKQLATLVGSGIPILDSLAALSRDEAEDELSRIVVPDLSRRVSHGARLSVAMGAYARIFPKTYLALLRAAEETGNLAPILNDLALWLERKEQGRQQVKKALTYPVVIVIVSAVLTVGLFQTVLPSILDTVLGLGVALPAPTRLLLVLVAVIKHPLTWVLALLLGGALVAYLRTEEGWTRMVIFLDSTPMIGDLLRTYGASRYSLTLAMLVERGVDIMRAVRIASEAAGTPLLEQDCNRISRGIREGHGLGEMMRDKALYPGLLTGLTEIGDESGQLCVMLRRAGDILAEDVSYRVDAMLNLLEPIVLGVLSMGVGFVIVAILMPLASLTASL